MNTGPEIPVHLREKIFEPLYRSDPSRSRKTGGLGLGLAISKKIMEHHGVKIVCDSANGITQFSFCMKTEGLVEKFFKSPSV
jgi:signal transduction histidine kinase